MKKRVKMICFDMDGTIADLYGVDNWLTDLENHNAKPYEVAKPLHDMTALTALLEQATAKGIEIRVITWLAKGADRKYKKETRVAKREWLKAQGFATTKTHCIQYGTTKANCIRNELKTNQTAILIDDNAKVRRGWTLGGTIDPTAENFLEKLAKIIEQN